jgi:uncharacterized membrane protein
LPAQLSIQATCARNSSVLIVIRENAMADIDSSGDTTPASLVSVAQVIYGLHALSILIGLTSAITIVGAFVFGVPSIIAVIVNYAYRDRVRGSFLESHFRWQIRTFWFALLWIVIGIMLFITLIGIPLAWITCIAAGLWVIYRVARGWLTLQDRKPMMM